MRILHLLNTGKFSGAENVVCQIIDLIKDDCNCVYCSPDGSIRNILEEKGINFEPISSMSVAEVKRVIRKFCPDVIHSHDMRASFFAARACGRIPLVCHIHNNAFDSRKINLKSVLFFWAARKAKHIFWVSNTALSGYCFHSFLTSKSSVLLNIINVEKLYEKMYADQQSYSYDVAFVGRLAYPKNPERLLLIFKRLANLLPSYKAAIVGDGPLKGSVENLIKEYDLERNVSLLGFQKNPLKILHDSKVMILVSRWEGLPMCVLESIALGVPVISTCRDGIDSIVETGKNGFICDNDNDVLDRLVELISNDGLYKKMSAECIEISKKHNDLVLYSKKIKEVYRLSLRK